MAPTADKITTPLSRRETQVAELASRGLLTKEIAWRLELTDGAVKVYLSRVFRKIGVDTRVKLALYWIRHSGCLAS